MDAPSLSESLLAIAHNHHWTWSEPLRAILADLPGYDPTVHPIATIASMGEADLQALLDDAAFVTRVVEATQAVEALERETPDAPEVAYFSPEFGISDVIPQYSGGLGILAGDHLKAASDLGVSLCGVGLFYRGGFFRQTVVEGEQGERYEAYEPAELGCTETGIRVEIPVAGRIVAASVWRLAVGRVALILLDTDLDENRPGDRAITDRLYSGDRRHRIEQEMILGVGGARALEALGWSTPVCHLNEGHAGFLILDLLDRHIQGGATLAEARAAVRPGLVFTTHTPVPAGIDRFEIDLATEYLEPWARRWGVPVAELLDLGADPGDDPPAFNMAAFCLGAAARANGVSALHGEVSRSLFAGVSGGADIGSVTNGVHARTWVAPRLQVAFDEALGTGWDRGADDAWDRVASLDDGTVQDLRRAGGVELAEMVRTRTGDVVDPDALIVGFARRFATYKRATLLLREPDALAALLADTERPIHFVFAGKAHPADDEGKAVLADIIAFAGSPEARGRFTFVPDYDIAVARAMYAGADVWLNNPIRPHEASGTSGEKSALNGGLNCSISDGWWDEMADGRNGWVIPSSQASTDVRRDAEEAAAALRLLTTEIVAEYYADGRPWSAEWIERIRHNWRSLGPNVTAGRMVADYRAQLYEPALDDVRSP